MFPENNRRVKRQKQSPIRVVIANPPYSSARPARMTATRTSSTPPLMIAFAPPTQNARPLR